MYDYYVVKTRRGTASNTVALLAKSEEVPESTSAIGSTIGFSAAAVVAGALGLFFLRKKCSRNTQELYVRA